MYLFLYTTVLLFVIYYVSGTRQAHPWGVAFQSEYCDYEVFKAQCGSGQIITIHSAMYGHMSVGRCIESDTGHLGCKADVKNILVERCSGKQTCQIAVVDGSLRQTQPCKKGYSLYLDVSFTCVNKIQNDNICTPLSARSTVSYIPSIQIFNQNCPGGSDLDIEANPGQQIEVTLINIDPSDNDKEDHQEVGFIIDGDSSSIGSLMFGKTTLSNLNKVSVMFSDTHTDHSFAIAYKALGCPDFTSPLGTTVQRENGKAIVTCSYTKLTWELTCRNEQWIGVIGNCSKPVISESKAIVTAKPSTTTPLGLPKDVIYLIIVCSTIFLSVLVVTTGFVCLKRARLEQQSQEDKEKEKEWDQGTTKMILIPKPRPNSDYLTPRCNPEGQGDPAPIYDTPLPDPPLVNSLNRGPSKRNNEEDYINTMSSNSTDYTRKYFVLDKDYMNTNNFMDA